MEEPKSRLKKAGQQFRAEGIAFSIPMVLLTFPVVGALLGRWIGRKFGVEWGLPVGLLVGLGMGIREVVRLVRLLGKIQD